VTRYQQVRTKK